MELKKQRLLVMLHPTEGEEKMGVASTTEQLGEREEEEEAEEVVGMKCRAPLKEVRRCLNLLSIDWMLMMASCIYSHGAQSTTTMPWCSVLSRKMKKNKRLMK